MGDAKVRVGIIGAGGNTRERHIPGLRRIPGVSVDAVCNRTRESSERAARELGIPRARSRWEEITEDRDLDAIVIGTWPYMHCPCTIAALEAGKHVLCEARMAMNGAEARRMRDAARGHPRLVAQVVPAPYTFEVDRTVVRLLAEGRIGSLLTADIRSTSGAFIDPASPLHWRQDARLSGLNVLALGILYECAARWIGHARSVRALSRAFVSERRDPSSGAPVPVTVPDHVDALAEMESGALLRLQVSAVTGLPAGVLMEALLFGSEGTLRIDASRGSIALYRRGDDGFREVAISQDERGGWRVEEEFIGAIRGSEKVRLTTFEEGARYMEFTEAVARAARDGCAIRLPLAPG